MSTKLFFMVFVMGMVHAVLGQTTPNLGPLPVYQRKPTIDVRDYGVAGNGTTDDTKAMQNAINAACPATSPGTTLIIPQHFNIKISSTLNFFECWGVTLDGGQAQGQTTMALSANANFLWYGAAGGTVMNLNRTRDSIFKNFSIVANGANNAILIDETTGSGIVTNNEFEDIAISTGNNANFIGINICPTAPGNCETQNIDRILINGYGSGIGIQEGPGGEPFYNHIHDFEITGFTTGIGISILAGNIVDIDGGLTGSNNTDLFCNGGRDVSYRHVRSECNNAGGCPSIVIGTTSGDSCNDLTVEEDSFSGLIAPSTTINLPFYNSGTRLRVIKNDWDNTAGITAIGWDGTGGGGKLDSQDNNYPTVAGCPQPGGFKWFTSENDTSFDKNCYATPDYRYNTAGSTLIGNAQGNGGETGVSPRLGLIGWYYSGGNLQDGTYFTHVPLGGYGSGSYLAVSHYGGTSPYGISLPAVMGGISTSVLTTPTWFRLTTTGTAGTTSYSYKLVANDGVGGVTAASVVGTLTTGNATLSGSNCNQLEWLANTGAFFYGVYRTASGGTPSSTGLIATVWPNSLVGSDQYTFLDCGLAGNSATPPSTNTTGSVSVAGNLTVMGNIGLIGGKGEHFMTHAANNDYAGTCTALSSATCTVTFTTAYKVAPVCTVTDQTNITAAKATPTTGSLVITTSASSSDTFAYICVGNPD